MCTYLSFENPSRGQGRGHQPSGFTVRFFLVDEGPFFLARVTLIGSGVLARASSSGTSYCWNDVGGGVDMRSNRLGVCCRETGADSRRGGSEATPSGISPCFSTTKRGGADREVSLRSANRRGSSLGNGGGRSSSRTTGIESRSSTAVLVGRSSVI